MTAAYAFQTKKLNRVKLIFWEGTDIALLAKPNGDFDWAQGEGIRLAPSQLSALLDGDDRRRTRKLTVIAPDRAAR